MVVPMVDAMTALRSSALWSAGVSGAMVAAVAIWGFLQIRPHPRGDFAHVCFATSKTLRRPEFHGAAGFRSRRSMTRSPKRESPGFHRGFHPLSLGEGGMGGHDSRSS